MAQSSSFVRYEAPKISDLEFERCKFLRVKFNDSIRLPIYDFLLLFNIHFDICPNSDSLKDMPLQISSYLEFDPPRLRNVNPNAAAVGFSIYPVLTAPRVYLSLFMFRGRLEIFALALCRVQKLPLLPAPTLTHRGDVSSKIK